MKILFSRFKTHTCLSNILKGLIVVTTPLLSLSQAYSQDIQFSQFYAAALYQNPAFAGAIHQDRIILHQRLQWPSLEAKYITSMVSYDTYFRRYKSGFGIMAFRDWQGKNFVNSTDIQLMYSYELNLTKYLSFRAGLQAGFSQKSLDYLKLTFPSQFDNDGFRGGELSLPTGSVLLPDVTIGGIFYSDRIWFGFTGHHVNEPNTSFLGEVSKYPAKGALVGGYKIYLDNSQNSTIKKAGTEVSITPTLHYKFQGKSDQFDAGIFGVYQQFMGGFWYRGIPIKKYEASLRNHESLVFLIGIGVGHWRFGYSYDATISKLNDARTGGSHELNITITPKSKRKVRRPLKRLPCPEDQAPR